MSTYALVLDRRPAMRAMLIAALLATALLAIEAPRLARAAACPNAEAIIVPGAEKQKTTCLADLTTPGLVAAGATNPADWVLLYSAQTVNPTGVAGTQIDGYFPDTPPGGGYVPNANNGWNHDAQFVIRVPNNWNGKLIVAGTPGNRRQYASDFIISDWVLARGYAYASSDKGNTGLAFYKDGATPGDALAEWHARYRELTVAAKVVVAQYYGRVPARTYAVGISNGGYQVRYAIENDAALYDGGVDWEGTLLTRNGPNLFTFLPPALKNFPVYANPAAPQSERDAAFARIIAAGFPPETAFLWPFYYQVYWDVTQRVYREEFDPEYDGALEAGVPFCASGTPNCDTDYDYASRPDPVKDDVAEVSMTGRIKKPLITLHGTLDTLLPISQNGDFYAGMVAANRRGPIHRYYVIQGGTHVDFLYDVPAFQPQLRPILPCARTAIDLLDQWANQGKTPPPSRLVPRPSGGDLANTCEL